MEPVSGLRKRLLNPFHQQTEDGPADFHRAHGRVEVRVIGWEEIRNIRASSYQAIPTTFFPFAYISLLSACCDVTCRSFLEHNALALFRYSSMDEKIMISRPHGVEVSSVINSRERHYLSTSLDCHYSLISHQNSCFSLSRQFSLSMMWDVDCER